MMGASFVANPRVPGTDMGVLFTTSETGIHTKFALNSDGNLVYIWDQTYNQQRLAADTANPGRLMFGTASAVSIRADYGTPNSFVTCRRDTSTTPNSLICNRPGDSLAKMWRCGGTLYLSNTTPFGNSNCYEVGLTMANEGCSSVRLMS